MTAAHRHWLKQAILTELWARRLAVQRDRGQLWSRCAQLSGWDTAA